MMFFNIIISNYICCEKDLSFKKVVEAFTFVLSSMHFSQEKIKDKPISLIFFLTSLSGQYQNYESLLELRKGLESSTGGCS